MIASVARGRKRSHANDQVPPLPYAMLAFLSLLWGSSFLLIKVASRAFDPFGFALGRVAIGAAALTAATILTRLRWPRGRRLWGRLAAMSLLGQVGPFLLLGAAARLTTSADLALMMGAVPIYTFGLSGFVGEREVWNVRAGLGLALGFAGIAVCLGFPLAGGGGEHALAGWGRGLGLLAALGYATGALLSREASFSVGPAMAATSSMGISTIALSCLWLGVDGLPSPAALVATPPASLAALTALGVINTALAYFVYFRLVAVAGATFAALNNYIVPFLGLIAGAALLGESVAPSAWFGFALVIVGVVLTGTAPAGKGEAVPGRAEV